MTFHWPQLFWLLIVPFLLIVVELRTRRRQAQRLTHPKILRAEAGLRDLEMQPAQRGEVASTQTPVFRWRLHAGLILLVVALARPQWGQLDEPVFDQAREIVIALDLSRSMLAPDVRPSRLDRARLLVTSLLERLAGERVGLIVFSGTAFLQSPLSSDYEILNEFLPSLNPDYLPQGGTNYQALIDTALTAFGASGSADRFLIILSDGEATDENWKTGVEALKKKGIRVIALGVGTAQGAILPDGKGGYVKDDRGAVVLSKLEPATLQELASLTQGVYSDASSWLDLSQLIQSTVETGRKGEFREERHARLVERFQWVLAPALLFLLWSFGRDFPVRPRLRDIKLRRPSSLSAELPKNVSTAALVLFFALGFLACSAPRIMAAENSAAEPLSKLVSQFAARPNLGAHEYSELARATVTYGERQTSAQQPVVEGSIRDALAAVDLGEALDAKAADWPKLRSELENFLKKQEPPPQQQQDKKDQDKKDQQDQQQQQQQDNKDSQQKKDSQDQQQQQQQQKSESSDPSQKSDEQNQPKESPDKQPPQDQKQDQKNAESAFGDMDKKPPEPPKSQPPPSPSQETQKVGGAESKSDTKPVDPTMVVPLQRLQQVREQDSPVRLQQLMRGNKPQPENKGKNW